MFVGLIDKDSVVDAIKFVSLNFANDFNPSVHSGQGRGEAMTQRDAGWIYVTY